VCAPLKLDSWSGQVVPAVENEALGSVRHAGRVLLTRAAGGESSRDTDDETFARSKLLGEIDLVAGRGLDEGDGWDGISFFDLRLRD
jgi:hypothetical protein